LLAVSSVVAGSGIRSIARASCTIVVLVTALLVMASCAGASRPAASTTSAVGETVFAAGARSPLPVIDAPTLSGKRITLPTKDQTGVTVINVWASWCTECRTESPALAGLARQLRDQGVAFVGIDEQDSVGAARAFARSTGMTYPHILDPDGRVLSRLSELPSYGIPSTLLVDRNGDMAARVVGATTAAQLRRLITKINS
jgi:thiol-disulfide isomerase/thioredoxin